MTIVSDHDAAVSEMIETHVRHLTAAGKSPNTIRDRRRLLGQLHTYLPFGLAYASTEELEQFLGSNPAWSSWTKATYAMHIRGFYRWAHRRCLDGDPTLDMARPRKPRGVPNPVTDEELTIALDRAPEPWRTAILLAAFAGLRSSEAADVRRDDVREDSIRIRQAKGGDPAWVDTHPVIWELARSRPPGPLARRPNGRPVSGYYLSSNGKSVFERIGLPGVHLHRFRHWFGTTLLDGGADLRTVQEAMRHASIISTQGYTLVRGGQRRLAIRSLPNPAEHLNANPAEDTAEG